MGVWEERRLAIRPGTGRLKRKVGMKSIYGA